MSKGGASKLEAASMRYQDKKRLKIGGASIRYQNKKRIYRAKIGGASKLEAHH
jgi:hypothetical protein